MSLGVTIVVYAAIYAAVYPLLFALFSYFFTERARLPDTGMAARHLAWILVVLAIVIMCAAAVPDAWWGNRLQHGLAGAVAMLMCFLAARGAAEAAPPLKWLVFSLLIVTALGVGNELVESVLQYVWHIPLAMTIEDTWLDFWSNAIGSATAGVVLLLAYRPKGLK